MSSFTEALTQEQQRVVEAPKPAHSHGRAPETAPRRVDDEAPATTTVEPHDAPAAQSPRAEAQESSSPDEVLDEGLAAPGVPVEAPIEPAVESSLGPGPQSVELPSPSDDQVLVVRETGGDGMGGRGSGGDPVGDRGRGTTGQGAEPPMHGRVEARPDVDLQHQPPIPVAALRMAATPDEPPPPPPTPASDSRRGAPGTEQTSGQREAPPQTGRFFASVDGAPVNIEPEHSESRSEESAPKSSSAPPRATHAPTLNTPGAFVHLTDAHGSTHDVPKATSPTTSASGLMNSTPSSPGATLAGGQFHNPQVMRGLMTLTRTGGGAMTIRLDPPSLGAVRIQMQMSAGRVAVRFHAMNEQARALLSGTVESLRTALEHHGLKLDTVQVHPMRTGGGDNPGSDGSRPGSNGNEKHDAAGERSRGFADAQQRRQERSTFEKELKGTKNAGREHVASTASALA